MSKIICDFCGATDSAANPVIAGDNASICKACVGAAHDIMSGSVPEEHENLPVEVETAKEEKITIPDGLSFFKEKVYGKTKILFLN